MSGCCEHKKVAPFGDLFIETPSEQPKSIVIILYFIVLCACQENRPLDTFILTLHALILLVFHRPVNIEEPSPCVMASLLLLANPARWSMLMRIWKSEVPNIFVSLFTKLQSMFLIGIRTSPLTLKRNVPKESTTMLLCPMSSRNWFD